MLKYIGRGVIPGIPAKDLSDDDVKKHGGKEALIKTGLYAEPKPASPKKKEE
jgi:hypothetical protein